MTSMAINPSSYPLPSTIFCVSYSVFNVKYFKKSRLSDSLIKRLTTKNNNGIPAPKAKEFFEVLKIQEAQKQTLLIAK